MFEHLLGGEAARVGENAELVAAEHRVGEDVGGVEGVGHVRRRRAGKPVDVDYASLTSSRRARRRSCIESIRPYNWHSEPLSSFRTK